MLEQMKKFLIDESAPTAVEYALMVAGISVAIMAIVFTLGGTVNAKFTEINAKLVASP